jgi:hypothetical protein
MDVASSVALWQGVVHRVWAASFYRPDPIGIIGDLNWRAPPWLARMESAGSPLQEVAMSQAVARTFKTHPFQFTLGLLIQAGGVFALVAHL